MKMKKVVTNVGKGIGGFTKGSVKIFKVPGVTRDITEILGVNMLKMTFVSLGTVAIIGGIFGAAGEIRGEDYFEL